jgi:uncharacterized protein (DUF1800 family)
MPYARYGLTPRQAAAHLLSRFTYGPRPGEVDAVAAQGLDSWFSEQLRADLRDDTLDHRLAELKFANLPEETLATKFIEGLEVKQLAWLDATMLKGKGGRKIEAEREELANHSLGTMEGAIEYIPRLTRYAHSRGYEVINVLRLELYAQKLLRAVYTRNQVREVLTDFWFNHFNVSLTNREVAPHILSYERDAIRPHVLRKFRALLGATAKHPALLRYLEVGRTVDASRCSLVPQPRSSTSPELRYLGLNENYARELLELHTLGVDGGYSQRDVEQIARVFTGWTSNGRGPAVQFFKQLAAIASASSKIVHQGHFYYLPFLHDGASKNVLGQNFPAGHGLDEGERVLDMLARHPSTAKFLARKLAVRFVAEHPDPKLVDQLARRYVETQGDLTEVYVAIVESPQFWSPAARRSKAKSGFEYVISSIRAVNGNLVGGPGHDLAYARSLAQWLQSMAQQVYGWPYPDGFPDRAEYWLSSNPLLQRINFAFALPTGNVEGVEIDPSVLHPPGATREQRIQWLANHLFPGEDTQQATHLIFSSFHNAPYVPFAFKPNLNVAGESNYAMSTMSVELDKMMGSTGNGAQPGDVGFQMMLGSESENPAPKKPNGKPKLVSENESILGTMLASPQFQLR